MPVRRLSQTTVSVGQCNLADRSVLNNCSPLLLWWGTSALIAGAVNAATKKQLVKCPISFLSGWMFVFLFVFTPKFFINTVRNIFDN